MSYPRAAILNEFNEPLELREITWDEPKYGQALVKVIASGICGSQVSEIRGDKNPEAPLPRLLGHEAVVRVLETGPGSKLKLGKAIAHWRKGDGIESEFPQWLEWGDFGHTVHTAGRITTFATHSVISENRLTPVPEDTPDELAMLLGCSLSTALGVVENEADIKFGESVLVIGCGGLGLNLILAAKLRQAGVIWAVDLTNDKLQRAIGMGANGVWMPEMGGDIGDEFDVVIDTTGNADRIAHGICLLKPSGRLVMVGQPNSDVVIPHALRMFDGNGKTIMATQGGRFSPSRDIPRYIAMWRAGRLNLDGLISHRFPLSEINAALDCVRNGHAGRVMLDCQEPCLTKTIPYNVSLIRASEESCKINTPASSRPTEPPGEPQKPILP